MRNYFNHESTKNSDVSVIITLYNYEGYIIQTLNSLLQQTMSNFELVIVDDCSTDVSVKLVYNWLSQNYRRFTRVLFSGHVENKGLGATRNSCFNLTRGKYVFVLDADNLLLPKCLSKHYGAITERKEAAFVYSYFKVFGSKQDIMGTTSWQEFKICNGNKIDAMALINKSTWENVGGYAEDMPFNGWEDYEFWFKIKGHNCIGIRIPEILCKYRVHANSMLKTETNKNTDALWSYLQSRHPNIFGLAPN